MRGFEPLTPSLPWKCSTPELHWLVLGLCEACTPAVLPSNTVLIMADALCRERHILHARFDRSSAIGLITMRAARLECRRGSACRHPDKPNGFVGARDPQLPLDYNLSGRRDSNPRPSAWKADALPTELRPLIITKNICQMLRKQAKSPEC